MTSTQQRDQLQSQIWKIANDVRGAVDGWDFKQFVLGTLFYRFISENFANYIEGGDDSIVYADLPDSIITPEIKDDAIKTKGYFIYPSQLFVNKAKTANTNPNLNTELKAIFNSIESSANGYPSEKDIKGLFADFDTTSTRLGNTVEDKNSRLAAVIKGVAGLDFGDFEDNQIDLFGDAYEFLIHNYAANAGKSGGEFFTPQCVSKLIARLAVHGQKTINKIYDPAAGSGSLLLQAKKQFDEHIIEEGFFGQEINHTTYNLARMNMFLHNINYDKFDIALGNTLIDPRFGDEKPFDAIVSNPPYSVNWIGSDDPTLINDDRFAPAGVLAPKSKADFAFVMHALSYLSSKGRAAIVCFPGIFYRGGAEQKIRKYLVDNNFVETVIALAPNLFYGTTIAVNILVLSKHKLDTKTQFIDATGSDFFKKETNNNILEEEHIEKIISIFDAKEDIENVSKTIDNKIIVENDYNLSVSSYVEVKETRQETNIKELNERIRQIVARENELRTEIDKIIAELGEDEL
ncbi:type I restriction-modification system subunit M [Bacteroides intestinalis]|uniref:type I restriction-modification system subunit M n=1 Tax=Bacteroides intestinalis TaxID=329854 RepID=UPI0022E34537|nr:type I restriction-modification system subunit M [Bacteroides intestinalis]